jgi:hypothetical protein
LDDSDAKLPLLRTRVFNVRVSQEPEVAVPPEVF